MTTPPDDPDFELIVPKGTAEMLSGKDGSNSRRANVCCSNITRREKAITLASIAKKYGTTVKQLRDANSMGAKQALKIGQSLIIPISGVNPPPIQTASSGSSAAPKASAKTTTTTTYTVRRGDTLSKIATAMGLAPRNFRRGINLLRQISRWEEVGHCPARDHGRSDQRKGGTLRPRSQGRS
jgi:hypothetical protein